MSSFNDHAKFMRKVHKNLNEITIKHRPSFLWPITTHHVITRKYSPGSRRGNNMSCNRLYIVKVKS